MTRPLAGVLSHAGIGESFEIVKKAPRTTAKRILFGAVLVLSVLFGAIGGWFFGLTHLRHDHFTDRVGALYFDRAAVTSNTTGGVVSAYMEIKSSTGLAVSFRVLRPAAVAGRVPVILLLAGHRTGRDAVDLVGDPGRIAVVAMDYP